MEKVVIIGSGCAGLTAAIYTARANLEPLVLTGAMPGGLLTTTSIVENYPGFAKGIDGTELMMEMQQQAERFGARIQFGSAVDAIDFSGSPLKLTVDGNEVETQTVVIASGAGHRHLGLESEAALEKKGVTYCATCDGALPMFRDQPLVVVGGGDSACEEATYLTRFASKVYSGSPARRTAGVEDHGRSALDPMKRSSRCGTRKSPRCWMSGRTRLPA